MKRLIVLLIFTVLCSCDEKICCTIIDVNVLVYVSDKNGFDLFNEANENRIKLEDIGFEYDYQPDVLIKAGTLAFNNPKLDVVADGKYALTLFPKAQNNTDPLPENSWIKIHWPDGSIDKVSLKIDKPTKSMTVVSEVFLNDDLYWPNNSMANANSIRSVYIQK